MFADLKEKAAGVDRKRIYTAAAALLIAGAAGQFMQRSAAGNGEATEIMAASVAPVPAVQTPLPVTPTEMASAARLAAPPTAESVIAMPNMATIAELDPAPETAPDIDLAKSEPAPEALPDVEIASAVSAPAAASLLPEVTRSASEPLLGLAERDMVPAVTPEPADVLAAVSEPVEFPSPAAAPPAEPETSACAVNMRAEASPGALLAISVTAPCNSGENVAFEHAGLKFSDQLGPDGSLYIEIPAMVREGAVTLQLGGGEEVVAQVAAPDFDDFDRIALVWKGPTGLQLHAFEGGAGYGEPGHVSADTPAMPDVATSGEGGFVSVLGSTATGFAADVYTYPAVLMQQGFEPEISVEAQVMENTCGGRIEGWILRTNVGREPTVEPLSMSMPGCDAVGEYLVLKNLPGDLKLARK